MRPVSAALESRGRQARRAPSLAWLGSPVREVRAFLSARPFHCIQQANFAHFLSKEVPTPRRRGAPPSDESSRNSADITALAGDGTELARSLPGISRATASSGPRPPACSNQDQERAHAISHDFPPPSAARHRRHGACRDAAGSRRLRQGYRRRLRLCRLARRLRLQPGARRRRRRAEEDGRHQGGRGGEGPGNRRGREDHGVDDQSRRRHAPVSDLVRLFQPARAQARQQISQGAVRACRRAVDGEGPEERRQLFRLYRRGAIHRRHRRRPLHQDRQARLRRRQADPAAPAQRQRLHARRAARQSERDLAGDLHRRLVDAGEGSGSHQQPRGRRASTSSPATSTGRRR